MKAVAGILFRPAQTVREAAATPPRRNRSQGLDVKRER